MNYPLNPGFKEGDTSQQAAESMIDKAPLLRKRCYNTLRMLGSATADEVAERLVITPFAARPRFTELKAQGLIVDTGERRPNISGRPAKVWRAA